MSTVRGQKHSFPTHERMLLWKCQRFWDRKWLDLRGTRPQPSDSCRIIYPFELSGLGICCPMLLNTSYGGIAILEVKLTFEMLAVYGQQHSLSTHGRVFLWKCQSFWDRICLDLRGTLTPKLWIHAFNDLIHRDLDNMTWTNVFFIAIIVFWYWFHWICTLKEDPHIFRKLFQVSLSQQYRLLFLANYIATESKKYFSEIIVQNTKYRLWKPEHNW